ncbi:PREDICTED: uncharacterized protein LOC109327012 [Lupinus angustifolius]|uniref:uncharacterized protein LOC109327012 n=1 Tax=Lupinus angustifolius TaxID=3871 RepID=UPI00092E69BC|nr:PREDICTED: uncharacterized protein LOC109327012 [Lupinus angustifolius]
MAPIMYLGFKKVLFLYVVLFAFVSLCFSAYLESNLESKMLSTSTSSSSGVIRRKMLELEDEKEEEFVQPLKKKSTKNNNTKLIKPNNFKNQTKLTNKTKTILTDTHEFKIKKLNSTTIKIKKLNSTTIKIKKLNSTSKLKPFTNSSKSSTTPSSISTNSTKTKSLDLLKTTKDNKDKNNKLDLENETTSSKLKTNKENKKQVQPSWMFEQDEDDLDFSELKDLPIKFQQTLLPDLEKISKSSTDYITKANKEITKGFKPYVGNKYAPTIATLLSCFFALIPLLFVSLLFNKIKSYFSLQKLLIFIQAYLSIYFFILFLSSLITGLEPLRFFYATSQSTYLCLQVLQTLAYVFYLLLLLMYLVLVFSTDCGLGSRFLGLAQTFVGFSIGLHYYVMVFHRVVLRQGPKTNWKMHGIYATCFFLICFLANADRRKKTYLEEGGEEGKKN